MAVSLKIQPFLNIQSLLTVASCKIQNKLNTLSFQEGRTSAQSWSNWTKTELQQGKLNPVVQGCHL